MSIAHFSSMTSANNVTVQIDDHILVGVGVDPGSSSAGIIVTRDGRIRLGESNTSTTPTYVDAPAVEWATPKHATVGDAFEVRMDTTGGTLSVGTANTWQALTSDRTYERATTGAGANNYSGTLRIRLAGAGVDSDSGAQTLNTSVIL